MQDCLPGKGIFADAVPEGDKPEIANSEETRENFFLMKKMLEK
jgi:hypothetical protein